MWFQVWLEEIIDYFNPIIAIPVFVPKPGKGITHILYHEIKRCLLLGRKTMTNLLLLLSCFSRVRLCATPQTAAHQAPPSLGFSRQEHCSGLPFPSPMHESEREVAQSCPTLSDPMDCSLPGSSVHGIFQARVLEWVPLPSPMTNLDSILKSKDISLLAKDHLVKATIFPLVTSCINVRAGS